MLKGPLWSPSFLSRSSISGSDQWSSALPTYYNVANNLERFSLLGHSRLSTIFLKPVHFLMSRLIVFTPAQVLLSSGIEFDFLSFYGVTGIIRKIFELRPARTHPYHRFLIIKARRALLSFTSYDRTNFLFGLRLRADRNHLVVVTSQLLFTANQRIHYAALNSAKSARKQHSLFSSRTSFPKLLFEMNLILLFLADSRKTFSGTVSAFFNRAVDLWLRGLLTFYTTSALVSLKNVLPYTLIYQRQNNLLTSLSSSFFRFSQVTAFGIRTFLQIFSFMVLKCRDWALTLSSGISSETAEPPVLFNSFGYTRLYAHKYKKLLNSFELFSGQPADSFLAARSVNFGSYLRKYSRMRKWP